MSQKINYEDYGYEPGTKITMDESLYGKICELIQYISQKERYIAFEEKESLEDTFSEKNNAKYVVTAEGLKALSVILKLNELHVENVNSGLAKHIDELEKPQVGIPKVTLAQA